MSNRIRRGRSLATLAAMIDGAGHVSTRDGTRQSPLPAADLSRANSGHWPDVPPANRSYIADVPSANLPGGGPGLGKRHKVFRDPGTSGVKRPPRQPPRRYQANVR